MSSERSAPSGGPLDLVHVPDDEGSPQKKARQGNDQLAMNESDSADYFVFLGRPVGSYQSQPGKTPATARGSIFSLYQFGATRGLP